METVTLDLGEKSYPIYIGGNVLNDADLIQGLIRGRDVLIVTNETISPLYLHRLKQSLGDLRVDHLELPDGEEHKTLTSLDKVVTHLLQHGHKRTTTIMALGGGVVGDTAGFAAATYQRGVDFIQVPTTLLSQVDSSVGGKTAVNHALGKNMIGAFYQPKAVLIDTTTLTTLPERELSAGLAEVIKHGALADADYLNLVEVSMPALLARDPDALTQVIKRSCEIKASVVAQDEKETGVRALLNLGHTFGHAIENAMGYGSWLHGEAVGAGMVMAADLSVRLGMLDREDGIRLRNIIASAGLPVAPPPGLGNMMLELMARDKKATDAGLRFILLEGLGQARLIADVDADRLSETINASDQELLA